MDKILATLKVWAQRLTSADAVKAITEGVVVVGLGVKIYHDAQTKDLQAFLTDLNSLPADFGLLALSIRLMVSGNKEAIADPTLPQITGQPK